MNEDKSIIVDDMVVSSVSFPATFMTSGIKDVRFQIEVQAGGSNHSNQELGGDGSTKSLSGSMSSINTITTMTTEESQLTFKSDSPSLNPPASILREIASVFPFASFLINNQSEKHNAEAQPKLRSIYQLPSIF
jgi:hypothetical protein